MPSVARTKKGAMKAAKSAAPKVKLTRIGQHPVVGSGCIATMLNGKPCPDPRVEKHLPYCKSCMRSGDPSLQVMKHPKFGKCLIARRNLKKGYRVAWWGNRVGKRKLPTKHWEWALETCVGVIDAVPYRKASQLQFCQCPGPSEKPVIDDCTKDYEALLARKDKTCLIFSLLCDVPKGHQLTMMYNKDEKTTEEFFAERGIVRSDVGCPKYPALKKDKKMSMKK
eukprot:TRINITY_DN17881_c0_g1_i1.p1 TRINITY_DN17881_c0_g1~~TRINITY_DN17881_c0_g1_i1.p1  ORF type:complete len:224 (-),score=45.88 TRINITY_DN17881_c0_g1_i1:288-959(-)